MNVLKLRNEINSGTSIYDMEIRVTYYGRVSTDKDAQLNSLDNQIFYFEKYIKEQSNWTFVPGYVDEGISGKSAENREDFMRMIKDAKAGKFDLIVTKEISRFSRNTLDSIKYTRELLYHGVGVYFQSDNINTLAPDAELRLTIMASIAQDELRKLSERLRFGYKRAIERGHVLGQDNMLGYRKSDCKLTIDESEAILIKRIFDLYIEGKKGLRGIARQLENEGFVSPNTGQMFTYGTLQNIIQNPKYKGYYCSRKTVSMDYRDNKQRRQPQEDWIVYKDENIPPIVSEEIWDKANKLYKQRSQKMKEHAGSFSTRYPLSSKLICADHGTSYHRHIYKSKKHGEQEVWNCKMYRLKGKEEGCDSPTIYSTEIYKILGDIYRLIYDQKAYVVDGLMEIYSSMDKRDYAAEIARAEKEIAQLTAKKDQLLDYSLDGTISRGEFKKRNEQMNTAVQAQREIINSALAAQEDTEHEQRRLNEIRKALDVEYSNPENYVTDLSKVLLDKIIVHKINGDKRHVKLEILLTIGKSYEAVCEKNKCILLQEIGISQAQVSRLEKSALTRIKKQI